MRRWFQVCTGISADGSLLCHELRTRNGTMADEVPDFVEQLVDHILGYATHGNVDLDEVFNAYYRIPELDRTALSKRSIERLLAPDGRYRTLKGFAGECLSHWFYESFAPPLALTSPKAHSSDPAFDLVGIDDLGGTLRTVCVQSKATAGNAGGLVGEAVSKYQQLHTGEFDFQLANELALLARSPAVRSQLAGRPWRTILMTAQSRDYAIVVAYDGTPPLGPRSEWPTNWATAIPGPARRRALITLPLASCDGFIDSLVRGIRAKAP